MSSPTAVNNKKFKTVIIGSIAGGATAAARLHRLSEDIEVTMIDKTSEVSRASCGLPYYFNDQVKRKDLQLQTATGLEKILHQKILINHTALKIDRGRKTVTIAPNSDYTKTRELPYDKLIISTGGQPVYPPIPGILAESRKKFDHHRLTQNWAAGALDYGLPDGLYQLQNLADADRINAYFHRPEVQKICVIGTGFVGLEVAEAFRDASFTDTVGRKYHKNVTLLEVGPTVLPAVADPEIGAIVNESIIEHGVDLRCAININKITSTKNPKTGLPLFHIDITSCNSNPPNQVIDVDMVLLSTGVAPRSELAKDCGLFCGARGHIRVDEFMRTQTDKDIYAVGDVIEHRDFIFPQDTYAAVALGNLANQEARVAADHIFAEFLKSREGTFADKTSSERLFHQQHQHSMPGFLGTAIVRAFDNVFATTGWSESRIKRFRPHTQYQVSIITNKSGNHAAYYKGAQFMTLKVIYEATKEGRILGAQAVGGEGVDKRIDVIATAIMGHMSIDQLASLQLCYSPQFGSARDTVNVASLLARNQRQGLVQAAPDLSAYRKYPAGKALLIDVRLPQESQESIVPDAVCVPFGKELEDAVAPGGFLDKNKHKKIFIICIIGRSSYFSARMLAQRGFDVTTVQGGISVNFRPPVHLASTSSKL